MNIQELAERDHVLVALDGPVAILPSPQSTADRLRIMVAEGHPPREVARTADPFVILGYAATIGPATEQAVYRQLCLLESEMAATAPIAPGVHEAFALLAAAGTQITAVSSLAAEAVRTFLVLHGLDEHVRHFAARTRPDRAALPPAPDLITAAIHERAAPIRSCLFVGSADIDLAAARAAGVDSIRYRAASPTAEPPAAPPPNPWFDALAGEPSIVRR